MKLRLFALVLCLCILFSMVPTIHGQENTAGDITGSTKISGSGYTSLGFLTDGNTKTYHRSAGNASITLENEDGIGSLYLLFDEEYGTYTITDNNSNKSITFGQHGYLHEFVDLTELRLPTSVTISFTNGPVRLSEIYVYSPGKPPEFVQQWDQPLEGCADILLLPAHGGDEHLFFAGLLPYYIAERNCSIQVAYLTNHRNDTKARTHEMLNGLWAVGVRAYPVFGTFDEVNAENAGEAYDIYASQGISQEDLLAFTSEQIRRFRPQVVVGHSLQGERGDGMRMLYADLLTKALEVSNDAGAFPEQAAQYGLWDVPKAYLHLYEKKQIQIDYDQPLESLDGMTAFEVSQKHGYPCHDTLQKTWSSNWINGKNDLITKAAQIETDSPCTFGLYRTIVGKDKQKNDILENVYTYAEQEQMEQERLEQEKLEQERLEQEKLEQEQLEQERLEQERLEQERRQQARLEQQRLQQEQASQKEQRTMLTLFVVLLCALTALLIMTVAVLIRRKRLSKK